MAFNLFENRHLEDSFFILLMGCGLGAYYIGLVNMYIWMAIFILWIFSLNRVELGFSSLLIGSSLFGRMFASQLFNIVFIIFFLLLGIVLLHKEIIKVLNSNLHAYLFFSIFIVFFIIEFLLGPQTDYSKEKIVKLVIRGFIWLSSFLLILHLNNISAKKIAMGFLILAIFYLFQSYQLYHIIPRHFYDFSFFRDSAVEVGRNANKTMMVNSHTLGYLSLAAFCFWFGRNRDELKNDGMVNSYLFSIITVWIVALSGARQVLLSLCLIVIIRYLLGKSKTFTVGNIVNILGIIFIFYFFISIIGSSHFDRMIDTNNSVSYRLHRDTNTPLEIMDINPIWGVGFGGYPIYANKDYPHNLFLEIICELGMMGLIILSTITICYFLSINRGYSFFRMSSKTNLFLFPLFILLLSRSMISGDMADNISVFCFILIYGTSIVELEEREVTTE